MKKSFVLNFALSVFVLTFLMFSCTKDNKDEIEETIEELPYLTITIDGQLETFDNAFADYCNVDGEEFVRVATDLTLLDTSLFDPPYPHGNFIGWYRDDGTEIFQSGRVSFVQMINGILDTSYLSTTAIFDIESADDYYVKGSVMGTFETLTNDTLNYSVDFNAERLNAGLCN
jgi:hypothetical protein